jgi:hypothetical protein
MSVRDLQRGARPVVACLLLLAWGAIASSCGGGAAAVSAPADGQPSASADPRLLPLGTPVPAIPAQVGAGDRAASAAGQIDYKGSDFLNAAGATVDGDTVILQSTDSDPAWAMYKAGGLAGLKVNTFAVETIPGDLDTQYSVGLSNFSDGTWDYFINSSLPEVDVDLSHNTKRLVSHLGNLYWVVIVSGGKSLRVVAGHALTESEGDGDWCPERVTGLTASQGLPDHIHLEWNKLACARKYEVWGRLSPNQDQSGRGASCWYIGHDNGWVKLGETQDNSFDDYDVQASLWIDYKVRARNHCGMAGFSDIASGYMGDAPGGGGNGGTCDSQGVITSLDDASLALDSGASYALTADTQWLLDDGGAGMPSDFAVGDTVAVHGESVDGQCTALVVTMVQKGGDPVLFDAESIIVVRDGGLLALQNGMSFTYDDATEWLDVDGNPASIDLFVTDTPVHVWGSILGQGPAKALKVQLEPANPA